MKYLNKSFSIYFGSEDYRKGFDEIFTPGIEKTCGERSRTTFLLIRCAWCGKEMGQKESDGITGISHSICSDCLMNELAKIKWE